jgi:hypothetical protein
MVFFMVFKNRNVLKNKDVVALGASVVSANDEDRRNREKQRRNLIGGDGGCPQRVGCKK